MDERSQPSIRLSSDAIDARGNILSLYTCDGRNINPSLYIEHLPDGVKTLALILEDPDAGEVFDHWLVWNIEPTNYIARNTVPGTQGRNGFGRNEYGGPCPPAGIHRYVFKIYALDTTLKLRSGSRKTQLLKAIEGHILGYGELVGRYRKLPKGDSFD